MFLYLSENIDSAGCIPVFNWVNREQEGFGKQTLCSSFSLLL